MLLALATHVCCHRSGHAVGRTFTDSAVTCSHRMFAAGVSMREMDPSTSFGAFVSAAPAPSERASRKHGGVAAIMGHISRARGLMPGQFATPTRHESGTMSRHAGTLLTALQDTMLSLKI